jgi:hypothetical protein
MLSGRSAHGINKRGFMEDAMKQPELTLDELRLITYRLKLVPEGEPVTVSG